MKKIFFLVTVFILIAFNFASKAEQQTTSSDKLSPEEVKQLQEGAKVLGQAFGIKPDIQQGESEQKENKPLESEKENEPQKKTFADVGDKALNMVQNMVVSLSQTLEKVAPQIWRVMIRQQYAKAIADLILPWSLFFTVIIYTVVIKRILKWKEKYDNMLIFGAREDEGFLTERGVRGIFTTFFPFIISFIFALWGCITLKSSIILLINPEYYAIRDLLLMIMNPGQTQ